MAQKVSDINDEIIEIVDYPTEREKELEILDRKCDDWVADKLKVKERWEDDNKYS